MAQGQISRFRGHRDASSRNLTVATFEVSILKCSTWVTLSHAPSPACRRKPILCCADSARINERSRCHKSNNKWGNQFPNRYFPRPAAQYCPIPKQEIACVAEEDYQKCEAHGSQARRMKLFKLHSAELCDNRPHQKADKIGKGKQNIDKRPQMGVTSWRQQVIDYRHDHYSVQACNKAQKDGAHSEGHTVKSPP